MARNFGITFFVVIHQPRSSIFDLFDHLILLSDGQVCYNGPSKIAAAYVTSLGFRLPVSTPPHVFASHHSISEHQ